MSSVTNDVQEEVARARQKIPEINNKCVAEMRALLNMVESNAKDFKAMVENFVAITAENTERERVGAIILQAEYREFLPYVIKELKSRRTVFSGWFMATTPLMMPPNVLALEHEIACAGLQKFIVTDEIGKILIDALGITKNLYATRIERDSSAGLQNQAMHDLAHQLMIQMHKQIPPKRSAVNNLYSLIGDGCGTACSCGHDFGGIGFNSDGEDNGAAMAAAADSDLEAFMARKKLESSDSIVQRPSGEEASPPKATRTKKRKTNK